MSVDILTFGCRLNTYESEVMRSHAAGLTDTIIVNTCAVTAEAERQARQAIRRVHRDRPDARIVVTGCAAQIDPAAWAALPGVQRVLGNIDKLTPSSWLTETSVVSDISTVREVAPQMVSEFAGRARAFLQVQQGCDHRCTFCIIPFGRGPSRSVPIGAVARELAGLVASGYREAVLTGVDLTSFGADLPGSPTLGQLVRRLLALVPDLPRLRLSSLDPEEIDDDLWRLIAEEPRLMPHLHLSLQSGNDLILKRMKRRHSRAGALATIRRAQDLRPGIAIGADLIAGFPTETLSMFEDTLNLVAETRLPFVHVFPYSERPGTPAARMPSVPQPVRRERAAQLRAIGADNLNRFLLAQIGSSVDILLETPTTGLTEHFVRANMAVGAVPGTSLGEVVAARIKGVADGVLLTERV